MPRKSATAAAPVAVICGPELFLVLEAQADYKRRALGDDYDPACVSVYQGSEVDAGTVLDELRTPGLFAPRRLVIVDDADPFLRRAADALERYLDAPSRTGFLLLRCRTLDRRTRLARKLAEAGEVHDCQPLPAAQIVPWIRQRAHAAWSCTIDADAARHLRELVGDDLGVLDAELGKLAAYVGRRGTITLADVEELVGLRREEKVFGILDAMLEGDASRALALWEQVWATDRAAPGRAIGGLAWSVRRILNAARDLQAGTPPAHIRRQYWIDPDRLGQLLRSPGLPVLEDCLLRLRRADADIKSGLGSVQTAIERYVVECTARMMPAGPKSAASPRRQQSRPRG